jgi:hypothetical protein
MLYEEISPNHSCIFFCGLKLFAFGERLRDKFLAAKDTDKRGYWGVVEKYIYVIYIYIPSISIHNLDLWQHDECETCSPYKFDVSVFKDTWLCFSK